ncbi:MAG: PLDc N-terminal domain-containing protein [Nocardioidaceae bacterium]
MLFFDSAFGLVLFALWVFCLIDVITTDGSACRNLPKPLWVLVVLLLADLGAVIWLVAGRPWPTATGGGQGLPYRGNTEASVPAARQRASSVTSTNPDDDEQFLAQLRARAEEQRRTYREEQRRRDTEDGQD